MHMHKHAHTAAHCVCVCARVSNNYPWPTLAWLQRKWSHSMYKLSAEIKPTQNSDRIFPIFWSSLAIALTAAVPFLQPGHVHGRNFSLIVEGVLP